LPEVAASLVSVIAPTFKHHAFKEEREAGKSNFNRKILFEGIRFPLKALGRRISGK
jgi:hypothetical protein